MNDARSDGVRQIAFEPLPDLNAGLSSQRIDHDEQAVVRFLTAQLIIRKNPLGISFDRLASGNRRNLHLALTDP